MDALMSKNERGSVLILIILLASLLVFIPVGSQLLRTSRQKVQLQANSGAQAINIARAGLTDAVAWFRRQSSQPVRNNGIPYPDAAFYPRQITDDTMNEGIGLVKEYDLGESNSLYARYEVIRQSTNNVTSPPDHNDHAVHDITGERVDGHVNGEGLAWYIESVGYVYRRRDPAKPYNMLPNEVVGRARVATEVRRVMVNVPSAAATLWRRRDGTVNVSCQVNGGSQVGAYYYTLGASSPNNWAAGTRTVGTAASLTSIDTGVWGAVPSTSKYFGVTDYELRLMADYSVASVAELPASYPSMALVYINNPAGTATFNAAKQLRGGGILVVNGNLTLESASNTYFSGIIYVTGNVVLNGPAYISGTLISKGTLTLNKGSDTSNIQYDGDIISNVQQDVGQYRENKSVYHVFSASKS
jgi:hypothetical protein